MDVMFLLETTATITVGKASYSKTDHVLTYRVENRRKEDPHDSLSEERLSEKIERQFGIQTRLPNVILLYDGRFELEFTNRKEQYLFTYLYSYTNYEQWVETSRSLPSVLGTGSLMLKEKPDDMRVSMHSTAKFFFNSQEQLLFIHLEDSPVSGCFCIANNLYVGLSGSQIAFLAIKNVHFL